jgi:hypothetical protein
MGTPEALPLYLFICLQHSTASGAHALIQLQRTAKVKGCCKAIDMGYMSQQQRSFLVHIRLDAEVSSVSFSILFLSISPPAPLLSVARSLVRLHYRPSRAGFKYFFDAIIIKI